MKNCLYLFLFLFACCNPKASGQDLLVTSRGDSLQVRLHEVEGEYIRFDWKERLRTTVRELPRSEVAVLIKGFYENQKRPRDTQKNTENTDSAQSAAKGEKVPDTESIEVAFLDTIQISSSYSPEWQLGAYAGLSKRLFSPKIGLSQSELDYLQKIKTGYSFGIAANHFFKKRWGLGLRYDTYRSDARKNETNTNKVNIQFIGLSLLHRSPLSGVGGYIQSGFEIGYQPYRNHAVINGLESLLHAKSMGWGISVGYHRAVAEKIILSLTGTCLIGVSYKMTTEVNGSRQTLYLNRKDFEDLTRAAITLGIAFADVVPNLFRTK
ncbi:outer membrane beta-barrel protein [Dyadobacter tibetensis]|uniref:outer membrane beta-barrel protein n=1 Tax=Dyadobacter tibetensis TaxID=1211851 RepID=UPI00103A24B9|nr:outer membrane beta-barrel protein [Dyadobacter tibetensis]